jgi:hypothetical protein
METGQHRSNKDACKPLLSFEKRRPGFTEKWIDVQLKADTRDRRYGIAREPGWMCRQNPVSKLLRAERPGSSFW